MLQQTTVYPAEERIMQGEKKASHNVSSPCPSFHPEIVERGSPGMQMTDIKLKMKSVIGH